MAARDLALPGVAALIGSITMGCGGTEVLGRERSNSCQLAAYETAASGEPPVEVRVATFWSDRNEAAALEVLADRARLLGPAVSPTPRLDRAAQQQSLKDLLTSGSQRLPDSYQVNGGSDVLQWVYDKGGKDSELCPLEGLATSYGMFERYFDAALSPASCHKQLFAVPIGIHRVNMLMVSEAARSLVEEKAAEQGVTLPSIESLSSSEAFFDYLEDVRDLDVETPGGMVLVPLSVGHSGTWPLTILAFDNMLAGSPGDEYEATWMGRPNGETDDDLRPSFERLASQLERLEPVSNLAQHLTWQDATRAVGSGDALFLVMGDWALAQLSDEEREGVTALPFPGTEGTFVYTPDSFSVPRRADDDGAAAHLWIREVLDHQQTQLEFAKKKQAIPAVENLDDDALAELESEYLIRSYKRFEACQRGDSGCRLLLAVSGLAPPPGANPCFDEVGYLLSRITGVESLDEIKGLSPDPERTCKTPLPTSVAEAKSQLVDLLLETSRTAYAATCR